MIQSESVLTQLKSQFYGYIFDDGWYSHIRHLVSLSFITLTCIDDMELKHYSEMCILFWTCVGLK